MKLILILASVLAYAAGDSNHVVKREPQYYQQYPQYQQYQQYPQYGYQGYGNRGYQPQNVNANQQSNAVGGAGSTVVADGTASAYGQRVKREPQYYQQYPQYQQYQQYPQYQQYQQYPQYQQYQGYGNNGYQPQNVNANQQSNAVGGVGSTVVSSGTASAYGQRDKRAMSNLKDHPVPAPSTAKGNENRRITNVDGQREIRQYRPHPEGHHENDPQFSSADRT